MGACATLPLLQSGGNQPRPIMIEQQPREDTLMFTGRRIEQVWYAEHRYPCGKPGWNLHFKFDSVDHYITLVTDQGAVSVGNWGGCGGRYGLRMEPGAWALQKARRWDVTDSSRWNRLIGRPVRGMHFHRAWLEQGRARACFTEALVLDFGKGDKVYLTVRDAAADEEDRPVVEQLSVFFDGRDARRYQVGPFSGISQRLVGERHFPVRSRVPWAAAVLPPRTEPVAGGASLQSLLGQRLEQVWYYDQPLPGYAGVCWNHSPLLDTPAHGVILVTSGEVYYLAASDGWCGLDVRRTVPSGEGTALLVEATADSRWKQYVGRNIRDVQVHWGWRTEGQVQVAHPLQLELIFAEGERVFLSTLACPGDPGERRDHLAVCFDDATARHFGVGVRR